MASTFAERVTRIEANSNKIRFYAGDDTPQDYSLSALNKKANKLSSLEYGAIFIGVILGALAGYIFQQYVGIDFLLNTGFADLIENVKADMMVAGGLGAVAFGFAAFACTLAFNAKRKRLLQFWCAYVLGVLGANTLTLIADFELTQYLPL